MSPVWTLLLASVCVVAAQYDFDGQVPPRPVVPGAVAIGGGGVALRRPALRGGGGARRRPCPWREAPVGRARRPLAGGPLRAARVQAASPAPLPPQLAQPLPVVRDDPPPTALPPRPVVEDLEELLHLEDVSPTTLPPPTKISPFPQDVQPSYRPAVGRSQEDFALPIKQQFRNAVLDAEPAQFNKRPSLVIEQPQQRPRLLVEQKQRPAPVESAQKFRPAPVEQRQRPVEQSRPAHARQQYNRQQQVVSRPEKEDLERPDVAPKRSRKPTSQVLRKYREDNADGSITWGFENDDGTFKEETIGVDCITRGKYGYIDPDGVRREFTYTSGIPCDKDRDAQNAEETQQGDKGYIDYSNNKYVLPNGDAVELSAMVKNKARKPVLRN